MAKKNFEVITATVSSVERSVEFEHQVAFKTIVFENRPALNNVIVEKVVVPYLRPGTTASFIVTKPKRDSYIVAVKVEGRDAIAGDSSVWRTFKRALMRRAFTLAVPGIPLAYLTYCLVMDSLDPRSLQHGQWVGLWFWAGAAALFLFMSLHSVSEARKNGHVATVIDAVRNMTQNSPSASVA
jgi:hypothetical protein